MIYPPPTPMLDKWYARANADLRLLSDLLRNSKKGWAERRGGIAVNLTETHVEMAYVSIGRRKWGRAMGHLVAEATIWSHVYDHFFTGADIDPEWISSDGYETLFRSVMIPDESVARNTASRYLLGQSEERKRPLERQGSMFSSHFANVVALLILGRTNDALMAISTAPDFGDPDDESTDYALATWRCLQGATLSEMELSRRFQKAEESWVEMIDAECSGLPEMACWLDYGSLHKLLDRSLGIRVSHRSRYFPEELLQQIELDYVELLASE